MVHKLLDSTKIEYGRKLDGWTILDRRALINSQDKHVWYMIRCDKCGFQQIYRGDHLIKGKTPKCKLCTKKERDAKQGEKFGHLIITRLVEEHEDISKNIYECLCDCGKVVNVRWASLRDGHTKSCGHLRSMKGTNNPNYKHGGLQDSLYNHYRAMKERCYNKNYHHYNRYGGRGITVCDEWKTNYAAFRNWAYANGYEDGLTLDRIDNNGNYCPENCRWTTQKEQVRNSTRSAHDKDGRALTALLEAQDLKKLRIHGLNQWRTIVKNRANGKCELCGLKGTDAHHWFFTRAQHSLTDIMPINGVFLCRTCHNIAHNKVAETKKRIKKIRGLNNLGEQALLNARQKIASPQDYFNLIARNRTRYKQFL